MEALTPQLTASLAAGSSFTSCGYPETNKRIILFFHNDWNKYKKNKKKTLHLVQG